MTDTKVLNLSELDGPYVIHAAHLVDGISDEVLTDMAIHCDGGKIVRLEKWQGERTAYDVQVEAEWVCPGFIDLQINGANDRQFNFDPTCETVLAIAEGARQGGTCHILPTFITDQGTAYQNAIKAVLAAQVQDDSILGIHLEGPFLSQERPGIHPPSCIRPLDEEDIAFLEQAAQHLRILLTLAPENQSVGVIERLTNAGVIVFVGHSNASADIMKQAEREGVRGATHLFNAMSQMSVREPGVVGHILASDRLFAGVIVDGMHVAPQNVKIAWKALSDRFCLVTDAMLTLAGSEKSFKIDGKVISLRNGKLTDAQGTLAGAHLAMDEAVRNLIDYTDCSVPDALLAASRAPAQALGLYGDHGLVKVGSRARLTLLDDKLRPVAVG